MRRFAIALAIAAAGVPAIAQQAPLAHSGQVIRDADMNKIGPISSVAKDGSVEVIYEQRVVTIPGTTISIVDGKPKTSLSKHDLSKL